MRLENGKMYVNGRGDKCGPMEERFSDIWLDQHGGLYHPDGRAWNHVKGSTGNLIHELTDTDGDDYEDRAEQKARRP